VWSKAELYRLGAEGNDPFASIRQLMMDGVYVHPGETYTFMFNMTAPANVGTYRTEWRMVQEGVMFFGNRFSKQVLVED
jgi:hypothetical protein